jgi:photosystem II stability/assembly factor-like uncharacterized protein
LFLALTAPACLVVVSAMAQNGWTGKRVGLAGKDLNAVYFPDSKHGWVGGDNGFVSRTNDGGVTWAERQIGTQQAVNDLYFAGKDTGYLLAANSIFSTSDGGDSWRESRKFASSEFGGATPELYSLRFNGKKRGWVVGSASIRDVVTDSILAFTKDGGGSWEVMRAPTKQELIHIDVVNDKHCWIVGASGTILHTDNGGESWTQQRSGTTRTLFHVDFRNEYLGWAVGEQGTILRTTDGGQSWVAVSSPVRSTLLSVGFVDDDDGWIVGRGGVILRSSDGGRTWLQQESSTKQNLYALFVSKKNEWAVGGDGLVLQSER